MNTENKMIKSLPIHYYITGDNQTEAIIFLHPAFADHRTFNQQLAFFSPKYKVITIDLLGHGQSQGIKTHEGIDSSAEHIREILDMEGIEKIHLVGVSIGSLIAQNFANLYPDRVLSLCSVGGYDINHYDSSIEKEQRKQQLSFIIKALLSIKWFSKSNSLVSAITEAAQTEFYKMNLLIKRRSLRYLGTLKNIMNKFQTERNYPLLILCGDKDNALAIKLSRAWSESESDSLFKLINKAGHCANMDNPRVFNETLMSFIDGTYLKISVNRGHDNGQDF